MSQHEGAAELSKTIPKTVKRVIDEFETGDDAPPRFAAVPGVSNTRKQVC